MKLEYKNCHAKDRRKRHDMLNIEWTSVTLPSVFPVWHREEIREVSLTLDGSRLSFFKPFCHFWPFCTNNSSRAQSWRQNSQICVSLAAVCILGKQTCSYWCIHEKTLMTKTERKQQLKLFDVHCKSTSHAAWGAQYSQNIHDRHTCVTNTNN